MSKTDDLVRQLVESLHRDGCETLDFEAELITQIGRLRIRRDQCIRDVEAARLIPLGAEVVVQRQGCHRSTAYRRASRAQKVARQIPSATVG